ncbi:hypothetical protein DL96DRAFT_1682760 [Flagelloscypha sp. PMI_526]|nr:hypothetical protein DL96DRAFT_1682760 [Flagelloscypha sp. PMI_526]
MVNAAVLHESGNGYFLWTSYYLSTFILSILFGVFALFGGAWWIRARYTPVAKAAGAKPHQAVLWIVWLFTVLFYTLTAGWTAGRAHLLTVRHMAWMTLALWRTELASVAFLNISTAGWMLVLLIHARILGTKLAPVQGQVRPFTTMFFPTLGLLGCLVIFGGIVLPAYLEPSSSATMDVYLIIEMITAGLLLAASCSLLCSLIIIRKTTHLNGQLDPLRKVVFIAIPLWIISGIIHVVFAALGFVAVEVRVPFHLPLLTFALSSYTTILLLPGVIVGAESEKLGA